MRKTPHTEVEEDQIVAVHPTDFYKPDHAQDCIADGAAQHNDGHLFVELATVDPDGDNDVKGYILDEEGAKMLKEYVDADSLYVLESHKLLPWERVTEPEDELEEKLEKDRTEESHLDVRDEEQKNLDQMQEIKALTVAPDVLELPVERVTSASNSQQWVVIVDHPVLDNLKFYFEKPVTGWSDDYRIVEFLQSYGIHDGNPYKLQREKMYVEFVGDDFELSEHWNILNRDEARERFDTDESIDLSELRENTTPTVESEPEIRSDSEPIFMKIMSFFA